jgi:uncharacterized protein YdcH (DUF465 family)
MQQHDVTVWPVDYSGHGAKDMKFRLGWTQPIVISPHNADVLYTSAEMVFKSTDHGRSWSAISPDLTRDDKSKQESSGGPITKDNTSVEFYDTVFTIAESPKQKDLLWAGSDDGLIQISSDGGKSWQNVTPKGMPEWSLVSLIEASPHAAASAYAAIDCHKLDDLKPYIYKTGDFGKTWLKITKGIPDGAYVHVVREDPVKPGLLYAGTETGVFISYDAGASWQSLQLNLPVSPIHDLVLKNNDLLVATHGRSFWILDDISPLRQLAGHSPEGEMLLLNPALTYRVHFPDQFERHRPVGENPPNGAIVTYFFRSAPKGEVTLEILDDKGALIRRYSSIEKKQSETPPEWPDLQPPQEVIPVGPGFNRFTWDLRYAGPHKLPGEVLAEFRSRGPMAPPGNYQVKLSADGKSLTVPLELKMDPRVSVSAADMAKEFELELKIRDTLSSIHETIQEIREARVQLRGLGTRLQDPRFKSIFEAAESLDKKMTPIEEQLLQVNAKSSEANLNYPNMPDEQLHYLVFSVEVDDAPTQQQYAVFEALSQQTAPLIAKWQEIRSSDLVTLNNLIQQNVPAIYLSPGAN